MMSGAWLTPALSTGSYLCPKAVFDIIRQLRTTDFSLWHTIEGLFLNNELQCVVYLEARPCSTQQGDLLIND
jgi:hypothetical protein